VPNLLVGLLIVGHGLITTMIGVGAVTRPDAPAMTLPAFFSWWPGPFGRSWAIEALGLGSAAAVVGGLVWLASGLALVAAGLGWLGVGPLAGLSSALAVIGAALGLVALVLYFHPLYLVAVAINLALLATQWPAFGRAS
jgi:hypothetical protein